MSYLNVPRLHFAGTFRADPSTVNNTPQNFDPATGINSQNDGWNPNGTGQWQILNCQVQTVIYNDGTIGSSAAEDPVVGSPVQGTDQPRIAKLVDLDSEQQMVSEIYGFQVELGGSSESAALVGNFEVAAFSDIWFRAVGGGGGDAPMGAFYQSVLTNIQWGDVSNSRFLEQLMSVSPDLLSIKFNLDGINMDSTSPNFTLGRIVGTIGPATPDEPRQFVPSRLLRSAPGTDSTNPPITLQGTPPASPMFFAPFRVDDQRQVLLLDLGNSISTTTPGGPVNPALGNLQLAMLPDGSPPVVIGPVNYQAPNWYPATAGIQEFPLSGLPVNSVPLGIVQLLNDGSVSAPLLQEDPNGFFVRVDTFVFRLNPGETATVNFWATQFGAPAAQQQINLAQDPNLVNQMQSPPNPTNIPIGSPANVLATDSGSFPTSVTTDNQGRATVVLSAFDPGNPRVFIDGQVYGVSYTLAASNDNPDPSNFISVLVFNSYPQLANPTWQDVQPIFAQYAKLYPYMRGLIDLSSYTDVVSNLASIQRVFSLPKTDPGYMQVTRDMSRDKVNMILKWIGMGAPFDASVKKQMPAEEGYQ